MNEKIKHFLLLTVSTLIMAVGTYFFKFTNNFTFGGITGLAVLVADRSAISASDFSFIVNMILLVIGFVVLGKKFAAKAAAIAVSRPGATASIPLKKEVLEFETES